jgi:TetR/AcrR family transcriptional repressor of bet genes
VRRAYHRGPALRRVPAAPSRQRQRLIDACITALHIYGPSRTTVEKVVAIADLSPGIVRFYFASKAPCWWHRSSIWRHEFEERVMTPVSQLRPLAGAGAAIAGGAVSGCGDIASPRKVSVWYSFWGEASSRQEYYDICGKKDEDFAALVRELIERMIAVQRSPAPRRRRRRAGLIGVLEMLWQGIAFQSEASIDRVAARAQCAGLSALGVSGAFRGRGAAAAAGTDAGP